MPYKRNGRWFSDIRPRGPDGKPTGERVRLLLPNAKYKPDAKEQEHALALSLQNPEAVKPKALTFREFTTKHYRPYAQQNKRNYSYVESILKRLDAYFGDMPLRNISQLSIAGYRQKRAKEPTERNSLPKNSSINTEVNSILSSVLELARNGRLIDSNPCRKFAELPEEAAACPRLLPDDEARLLDACTDGPPYLRPLVLFALGTGMRREEILSLKWADIDFARWRAYPKKTKWKDDPRKTKGVPLSTTVREIIQALPRASECVFTARDKRIPGTTAYLAFQEACDRAGLTFTIHWLRHEFGSRLGDRNVSPYRIARLMGHANIKMSMRYVHSKEEDLEAAVEGIFSEIGHPAVTEGLEQRRKTA